jgi:hypothetical protein
VRALALAPEAAHGAEHGAGPEACRRQQQALLALAFDVGARAMRGAAAASAGGDAGAAAATPPAQEGRGDDGSGDADARSGGGDGGFAPWQAAQALWQLQRAVVAPPRHWAAALWACTLPSLEAGAWGPQELSLAAFALARLRLPARAGPPAVWQAAFLDAWARAGGAAAPRQLASVLWAAATLGWRPPPAWVAGARRAAAGALPAAGARDTAFLLWGVARLGAPAGGDGGDGGGDELFGALSSGGGGGESGAPRRRAAARPGLPLGALAAAALEARMPQMDGHQLALCAEALERLAPEGAARGVARARGGARAQQRPSSGGQGGGGSGGDGCGAGGGGGGGGAWAALLEAAGARMGAFTADQLTTLLCALARLRVGPLCPDAWADAAAVRLAATAPGAPPGRAAATLWALGGLGWRRPAAAAAAARLLEHAAPEALGARGLAQAAAGLALAGRRPPAAWVARFLVAARSALPGARARDIASVAWALAALGVVPLEGREGLSREGLVAAAAAPGALAAAGPRELARLVFALGVWRHAPACGAPWAALQARLRALLPSCSGAEVAVIAEGLGRMRPRRRRRRGGSGSDDGGGSGSNDASIDGSDGSDGEESVGGAGRGGSEAGADAEGGPVVEPETLAALLARARELLLATAGPLAPPPPPQASQEQAAPKQQPAPPPVARQPRKQQRARRRGGGGGDLTSAQVAAVGRGLALLGARPGPEWLAAWRAALEAVDASLGAAGGCAAARWATAVLEGRAAARGPPPLQDGCGDLEGGAEEPGRDSGGEW